MTTTLNASTAGAGGFIATGDNSGSLALQTAGTTAVSINSAQVVTLANPLPVASGGTGSTSTTFVNLASNVTGTLPIANGGTGASTLAGANIAVLNASNTFTVAVQSQLTYGPMYISNENNTDNVGRATFSYRRGGTEVGFVSTTNTSTAYNTSSDYRLKENIAPMTGALANVARLKPVTYKWKSTGSDGEGFIAHELAEVCPHAVTGEKDAVDENGNPKYQAIDTSFLVATLTAALQETKALIDTQAETINALTARIVALETA
jgi:hypothetical protein